MGRDAHEDVREGDEEAVGEETELLSAASLEGLDFDRLKLTPAEKNLFSGLGFLKRDLVSLVLTRGNSTCWFAYLLPLLPQSPWPGLARIVLLSFFWISTLPPTASSLPTLLCIDALCHSAMIAHFPHTGDLHFMCEI